jgi:hypothetical protein
LLRCLSSFEQAVMHLTLLTCLRKILESKYKVKLTLVGQDIFILNEGHKPLYFSLNIYSWIDQNIEGI